MNEIIYDIASHKEWAWDPHKPNTNVSKYILTRGQIAWAIANSYLNPEMQWVYMDWSRLRQSRHPLAKQRLDCLYDYFSRVQKEWGSSMNKEKVEYERVKRIDFDSTQVQKQPFAHHLEVSVHTDKMEEGSDSKDTSVIDFANSKLHIHSIISSVTQEELLFSICSECFLGLTLFPVEMEADECIVFRNVWHHADYTGYSGGFKFVGPIKQEKKTINIIAMDALMEGQYYGFERDIRKAYLGFASVSSPIISTGNWGCGAFGGNPTLKFLQQILAAQWAQKTKVRYSTFGNQKQKAEFQSLIIQMGKVEGITWEWVFNTISNYTAHHGSFDFEQYFKAEIMYQELK